MTNMDNILKLAEEQAKAQQRRPPEPPPHPGPEGEQQERQQVNNASDGPMGPEPPPADEPQGKPTSKPRRKKEKTSGFEDQGALTFAKQHASEFRFIALWNRWMRWDGKRWVPEQTLWAFDQARKLCREAGDADAKTGDQLMFVRADGAPWNKNAETCFMTAAIAAAGISPPISFHGLRHTYTSHCVIGGVPLSVVARNLGHHDVSVLQKHYAHLSDDYIRAAIHAGAPQWEVSAGNIVPIRGRS